MAENIALTDMPSFGGVTPAAPRALPTADEFFGTAKHLPTADEFFNKPARVIPGGLDAPGVGFVGEIPQSSEAIDNYIKSSPTGRIVNAFGTEAGEAWGAQTLPGMSDESIKALRDVGIFNKYQEGEFNVGKALNEAFMRPAAAALDTFLRGSTAAFRGTQAVVQQTGAELGAPNLGREVAAIPEAFMGTPHPLGIPKLAKDAVPVPSPAQRAMSNFDIDRARSLGVIGEGEAGWKGTAEPDVAARQAAETEAAKAQAEAEARQPNNGVPAAPETAAQPDIHDLARESAPETFQKFDALQQRKDTFRRWIDELDETRQQQVEAQAPHGEEIADLQGKMQDATPRLQKKYQARLDELQAERDAYIEENTKGDSADMAKIRQKLMETDYAMRDLAPDVGKAYRDAQGRMGAEAPTSLPGTEAVKQAPEATETPVQESPRQGATLLPKEGETAQAPAPDSPSGVPAQTEAATRIAADPDLPAAPPEVAAKPEITPPEQIKSISRDVSKKLVAAGRPLEEADAAGKLIASHYWARAARFNGEKGTGLDLYNAEAPEIKAGRAKSRKTMELAQKGRELNQERAATETPAFKAWFGDSKVVNEKGEPQVVYHGTTADFDQFGKEHLGKESDAPSAKEGFFFTSDPDVAWSYADGFNGYEQTKIGRFLQWATGGRYLNANEALLKLFAKSSIRSGENIKPVHLSLQNPLVHDFMGNEYREVSFKSLIQKAKSEGHDGVIFKNAIDAGYDSLIDKDQFAAMASTDPSNIYVAFEPNQIKSATGNKGTFDPNSPKIYEQSTRTGKINIASDARNTITLFKDADASTFIHETGHQWFEELNRDAADPAAPPDIVQDAKTVRDWVGAKDGEPITRKQHEQFARGFETYMMEGRAPSSGLARVFEQFRQWLTSIYQTVAKLRSPINNDIRDVFDRLIVAKPGRTVIAPERGSASGFADVHETDVVDLKGPEAHGVGERIQSERDRVAAEVSPEDENARLANTPSEARSGEAGSPQLDGHADAAGSASAEVGAPAESGTLGASGSQGAAEGIGARKEPRVKNSPASKEPRHQSLVEFLSQIGGIKSTDALIGDLRSVIGKDNKFVPGFGNLIRNGKGALSLDRAREAAVEAGYLEDEGRNSGRPSTSTIDHLLGAIDQELRGKKVYRDGEGGRDAIDADEPAKREHYFNGKLDAALDESGIAPADVSGAVRARVLEIMDKEGQDDPIAALERAWMEGDLDAVEKGSLEPRANDIPGWDVPDDTRADQGASRPDDAIGRPGSPEVGDVGARTGGSNREAPVSTNPNVRFERSDTGLIDKAGNIRLDKLNTTDDINAVLKETAEQNGDFMDVRGVVPDAQVLALADAAGVEATQIDMANFAEQFGKGGLASKVVKLRQMLIQSATEVRDLAAKAAEGGDVDLMAFAEAKTRHQMIQSTLSSVTAEAGRALRAFRNMAGMKEAQAISDFLRDATGRTLFQLRREAQLTLGLDTPGQVSTFMHDSAKPTFVDMALEYWVNSKISGPATHTTYSIASVLLALVKAVPETTAAAALGAIREARGIDGPRVYFGEVPAQLYGMARGSVNGIMAAWDSVKTGQTKMLPGELENMTARQLVMSPLVNPRAAIPNFTIGGVPVPVGTMMRIPSRAISAIHSFFRVMNYERELSSLAFRQATSEGLEGNVLAARIREVETNPSPEVMEASRKSATELTLMGKGGGFTSAVMQVTNHRFFEGNRYLEGQYLKFIAPFVHISSNVIEQALLQRTALGLLSKDVRADISGTNGVIARDTAVARMAVGSALAVGVGSLAAQGLVNGSGPSDPKERAIWTMVNGPPHSVRIGDTWYDVHRLGPLGMQVSVAADLYETAHMIGKDDATDIAAHLVHAFTQNILDESFMRGPADLMKALTDPDRYGEGWVRNFAASWVPFDVGLSQVARAVDPYSRSARTTMDAVKQKIPWLSQTLLPRVDVFGNSIPSKDVLGVPGLSAIYEQKVNNDPVPQAMLRLGIFPAMPQREIRGVDLTEQQYFDYATMAGHMAKQRLDMLVQLPGFSALPDTVQRERLTDAIKSEHERARAFIMMQNPDIYKQATDEKLLVLQGANPEKH